MIIQIVCYRTCVFRASHKNQEWLKLIACEKWSSYTVNILHMHYVFYMFGVRPDRTKWHIYFFLFWKSGETSQMISGKTSYEFDNFHVQIFVETLM